MWEKGFKFYPPIGFEQFQNECGICHRDVNRQDIKDLGIQHSIRQWANFNPTCFSCHNPLELKRSFIDWTKKIFIFGKDWKKNIKDAALGATLASAVLIFQTAILKYVEQTYHWKTAERAEAINTGLTLGTAYVLWRGRERRLNFYRLFAAAAATWIFAEPVLQLTKRKFLRVAGTWSIPISIDNFLLNAAM